MEPRKSLTPLPPTGVGHLQLLSPPTQASAPGARGTRPTSHLSTADSAQPRGGQVSFWQRRNSGLSRILYTYIHTTYPLTLSCHLGLLTLCGTDAAARYRKVKGGKAGPGDRVQDQKLIDLLRTPLMADQGTGQRVKKLGPAHLVGHLTS